MARQAARAIVLQDNHLLVMSRNKFGEKYNTLPGGNVEIGETHEQAVVREVHEETSIELGTMRLVFVEEAGDPYGTQFIFLCEYVSGQPALSPDSEEASINKLGQNLYEPRWVGFKDLENQPFLSEKLKTAILHCIHEGFPQEPRQIS